MSNNVQSHEDVAGHAAGEDRRAGVRHAARSLGSVAARIIGGSQVDLVNFSSRGVLFECDSRLLIGARASVRITTSDVNLIVTGRVVRSRVKGLVNGALRYDAALVLDAELDLSPAIVEAVRAETRSQHADADVVADDFINFESDFEPAGDPSPVEAYLAESEASLLDAHVAESPLLFTAAVETPSAEPSGVEVDAGAATVAEPPPLPEPHAADELEADQPIAFEPDGDIAFEPAVEFAFDDTGEPTFEPAVYGHVEATESAAALAAIEQAAADESAGTSIFDATYIPPADDLSTPAESQFVVTAPMPVQEDGRSSFFDARPSDAYGDAATDPIADEVAPAPAEPHMDVHVAIHAGLVATPGADVEAGEAGEAIDFETDVAFEAEDAVMFESAFEDTSGIVETASSEPASSEPVSSEPVSSELVSSEPVSSEPVIVAPVEAPVADASVALPESLDASPSPALPADDDLDPPAPVAVTEDRVLLQFAATVPHDLAELQRIAADNQW